MVSNKAAGTRFEEDFAKILAEHGFWAHLFQDNKNGQPCDVIAARDGKTYLFDCKDCQSGAFPFARIEENQYNAMKLFKYTGNSNGMFVIRFPEGSIYLLDFETAEIFEKQCSSMKESALKCHSTTLETWLDMQDRAREAAGYHADCNWK